MSLTTTKPISLDFYNNIIVSINAKQLDTESRYVEIICTDNGKKTTLDAETVKAFIRYKKPDGNSVLNEATITNSGTILVELTQQMLAVPGNAQADVILVDTSQLDFDVNQFTDLSTLTTSILSTMCFNVQIKASAIDNSEIESSHEYDALLDTMYKMVAIERELENFRDRVNAEEEIRKANETTRIDNENARMNAEILREQSISDLISKCETDVNTKLDECDDAIASIEQTQQTMEEATNNTITATTNANTATSNANTATANADAATERANTAAEACEGIADGSGIVFQTEKGVANGVATLDVNAKIPVEQLPNMNDGNSIQTNLDSINDAIDDLEKGVQGNTDAIGELSDDLTTHTHTKPGDDGNWWQGMTIVSSGGVTEVGKYIDFHNSSDNTNDYSTRIYCNGDTENSLILPTTSGTIALTSNIPTNYYDSSTSRTKNTVLAAPNGSNGNATFRSLVAADLPYPDYVVDKGTSGNWYYTKWNSGLAICHHVHRDNSNWYGQAWGSVFDHEGSSISFDDYPFEFKEVPFAFASRTTSDVTDTEGDTNTLWAWIAMQGGTTTTPPRFMLVRGTNATIGHPKLKMVAIGRWQ